MASTEAVKKILRDLNPSKVVANPDGTITLTDQKTEKALVALAGPPGEGDPEGGGINVMGCDC